MKTLDRGMKIKDIPPIEKGEIPEIKTKEDLDHLVEEPLLDICRKLYDLNIETLMSSANRKDIGSFANILIIYDTLSEENKEKLQMLSGNFPDKFELVKDFRGQGIDVMHVKMQVTSPDMTAGEISDYFFDALQALKIQEVSYGVFSKEELKQKAGNLIGIRNVEEVTEEDCQMFLDYLGCVEKDGKYYTEESWRRHKAYVDAKSQVNGKDEKSK